MSRARNRARRRCAKGSCDAARTGPVTRRPLWRRVRSPVPTSGPLTVDAGGAGHHTGFARWAHTCRRTAMVLRNAGVGGAAGSRTRVPQSRCSGLYVRRFRIVSSAVLRSQAASALTPSEMSPGQPMVELSEVEPRDVDPVPLRGIGGGSSRVFRPREPGRCPWHLMVPARFVEVARAPSARSPGSGSTTVETVSAPGCATTLCSCQTAAKRTS